MLVGVGGGVVGEVLATVLVVVGGGVAAVLVTAVLAASPPDEVQATADVTKPTATKAVHTPARRDRRPCVGTALFPHVPSLPAATFTRRDLPLIDARMVVAGPGRRSGASSRSSGLR